MAVIDSLWCFKPAVVHLADCLLVFVCACACFSWSRLLLVCSKKYQRIETTWPFSVLTVKTVGLGYMSHTTRSFFTGKNSYTEGNWWTLSSHIQCDIYSMWLTFNLTYIQFDLHSMWHTWNLTYMQCNVYSIFHQVSNNLPMYHPLTQSTSNGVRERARECEKTATYVPPF